LHKEVTYHTAYSLKFNVFSPATPIFLADRLWVKSHLEAD